jgi:hypothetical protein
MKLCTRCNTEKSVDLFYKQARSKDGLQRFCKPCANEFTKASEKKNHGKYYDIRKKSQDSFRREVKEFKAAKGCAHCEETDPICLELHHTDPTVKDLHPSAAGGRKMFYKEAEKCIVLCANCHRKEHNRLRNI